MEMLKKLTTTEKDYIDAISNVARKKKSMPFGRYLYKMRGLMNIKRYQNLFLHKQRSVAEHTWSVTKIAHYLGRIEKEVFNNDVDMEKLLVKCLYHDDIEMCTGDILSKTKRMSPSMMDAIKEVENNAYHGYVSTLLPGEWKDEFEMILLHGKDGSLEGDILKASDKIDTLFESIDEVKLGNTEDFLRNLNEILESLLEMELPSVQYFFKNDIYVLDIEDEWLEESVLDKLRALRKEKNPKMTFPYEAILNKYPVLKDLIDNNYRQIWYNNGNLFVLKDEGRTEKLAIQPSIEEMKLFVLEIAEAEGKEFNKENSWLQVKNQHFLLNAICPPALVKSGLDFQITLLDS